MKSCSITALRSNAYVIVGEVELSGEEVLLTSKGRAIAKVVPLEDEGTLKPAFVKEVQRRLKKDRSLPAEDILKRLW
ncbi:MAG: type II toxin-antitoxin system Phd/YefM family antitoxin [Patescibacteria group bacterium]